MYLASHLIHLLYVKIHILIILNFLMGFWPVVQRTFETKYLRTPAEM